jgi:hypothetical protein
MLSQKTFHKNRAGGVAQGEGPDFKSQYDTHTHTHTHTHTKDEASDPVGLCWNLQFHMCKKLPDETHVVS